MSSSVGVPAAVDLIVISRAGAKGSPFPVTIRMAQDRNVALVLVLSGL